MSCPWRPTALSLSLSLSVFLSVCLLSVNPFLLSDTVWTDALLIVVGLSLSLGLCNQLSPWLQIELWPLSSSGEASALAGGFFSSLLLPPLSLFHFTSTTPLTQTYTPTARHTPFLAFCLCWCLEGVHSALLPSSSPPPPSLCFSRERERGKKREVEKITEQERKREIVAAVAEEASSLWSSFLDRRIKDSPWNQWLAPICWIYPAWVCSPFYLCSPPGSGPACFYISSPAVPTLWVCARVGLWKKRRQRASFLLPLRNGQRMRDPFPGGSGSRASGSRVGAWTGADPCTALSVCIRVTVWRGVYVCVYVFLAGWAVPASRLVSEDQRAGMTGWAPAQPYHTQSLVSGWLWGHRTSPAHSSRTGSAACTF